MTNSTLFKYYEKSGLSLDYMENKVSSNFSKFLSGEKVPSFNQQIKIAKEFDIPVGLLLLDKPIAQHVPDLKFRTINSESITARSPELTDTIKEMQEKQDFLKSEVDYELDYIGKFSTKSNYKVVAQYLRELLDIEKDYYKKVAYNKQVKFLRSRINDIGVFVFFNGKVKDNTHRSLSLSEFRGFVLLDKKAPIIFVNQKDTKNGQVFTLIHELTHLLIGDEEILGQQSLEKDYDSTEAFVNKVTAEVLVPGDIFLQEYEVVQDISELAKLFKVSRYVIARRMLDYKKLTKKQYLNIVSNLTEEYLNSKKSKHSSGNYKNNVNFRIDKNFFKYVENALNDRKISYTDAFNIVGVGYKGFQNLKV